jgi:hypothetical protein
MPFIMDAGSEEAFEIIDASFNQTALSGCVWAAVFYPPSQKATGLSPDLVSMG